jgi:phage terminase Nu1 subunit (DNA packaging protein)
LVVDAKGKAKIADVALADREWAENTDLSKAPGYVKERTRPGVAGRVSSEPSALAEASTREKEARAKLAELEYQRKAGLLIEAKTAEDAMVDLVTRSRTKLLGVPSRIKSVIPELTHAQVLLIDRQIREALEELVPPTPPAKTEAA